ncbi:MAG: hypothetical protein JNK02_08585 [Planctomycetes bacterium]|nr:hypothetical protein [Planctomycetota bacterium]
MAQLAGVARRTASAGALPPPARAGAVGCLLLTALCLGSGCTTPPPAAGDAAFEARVAAAVEERLQSLFPEVERPWSRAAIAEALATEAARVAEATDPDGVRARAAQALAAGDDATARRLLSELAAEREAGAARALLARGDLVGALAAYDVALEVAPSSALLWRERAETALELGLRDGDRGRLVEAAEGFAESQRRGAAGDPAGARTWLGASRAARALGDVPRALDAARRAFALARTARDLDGPREPAERTRAEAALLALAAEPSAEAAAEARTALEALAARTPDEPWAWARLAEVLAAHGAPLHARAAARTGLAIFPRDPELVDTLAGATRALGGREAVLATFEELERHDPADAALVWRPAEERLARGLEQLAGAAHAEAEASFREAGRGFLRAGALAPDRRSAANSAVARALVGVGLVHMETDDPAGARAALVEADGRDPLALRAPLAPGLPTGLEALRAAAERLRERGADPSRADALEALEEAALAYVDLRRIAPRGADEALLTADLARDAALAREARARRDAERGRRAAAEEGLRRARALMEAALVAATDAARGRPDDDAALRAPGRILVHYLQREVTQAESWLRAALPLAEQHARAARGRAQEAGIDATQREERARRAEEAESRLGDLYQDLGVLHLELKGDPHGARVWFERALATGPDPREDLRAPDGWIARCDAALASGTDPRIAPRARWATLP